MLNLKSLTWKTGKEITKITNYKITNYQKSKPRTVSFQRGDFNVQLLLPLPISEKVGVSEQKYNLPCETAETLITLPERDCASLDSSKHE